MPKYIEAPASIPQNRWLKIIANETAEVSIQLRKLNKNHGNSSDSMDSDDAGLDP
jgi:hypothetical protein